MAKNESQTKDVKSIFLVWLRNRLISAKLEPVLSHTEKSIIASTNKNHKIHNNFVSLYLRPLGANKTGFNLVIFHFNIRGKLSIIEYL